MISAPPRTDALAVGRVLIVDDNAELAGALRDVLLAARTEADPPLIVTIAERGSEALALVATEDSDASIHTATPTENQQGKPS
ncbi:hypothetical protein BH09MYX1_BH09MYX1_39530 [soil metagenome]